MYVAAKYEEMYPPALEEFSFITDNTYETKHILRMEQIVMKVSSGLRLDPHYVSFLDAEFFTLWSDCLYILAILFNTFETN